MYSKTLIALDIETTDIEPTKGEIIEVAAIKFKGDKILDEFKMLVNPGIKVPFVISSITGIKDEDLKDAPKFDEVKNDIEKFLGEYPIVGHNIIFDINFLKEKGINIKNPLFDTWKLSSILLPTFSSFSLEYLTKKLEIEHFEKHRAYHDAKAGMLLFNFLIKKIHELNPEVLGEINKYLGRSEWDLKEVFSEISVHEGLQKDTKHHEQKNTKYHESDFERKEDIDVKFDIQKIKDLFDKDGRISKSIEGYEFRPPQTEMVKDISIAFDQARHLLIEAGAGVGKSMAYLVPTIYFSKSQNKKVVISTNTVNLQNQLIRKDIPQIRKFIPFNFSAVFLGGRNQYICRRRLEQFKKQSSFSDDEIITLTKIIIWLSKTKTGLFSELGLTREDYKTTDTLTSDKAFCSKKHCKFNKEEKCFLYKARDEAKNADIAVVNHALLISDSAIQGERILRYKHLIIDEAHHLENITTRQFGYSVKLITIEKLLDDLFKEKERGKFLDIIPRESLSTAGRKLVEKLVLQVKDISQQSVLFFGILGMSLKYLRDVNKFSDQTVVNDMIRGRPEWERIVLACSNLINKLYELSKSLTDLKKELAQLSSDKIKIKGELETSLDGYIQKSLEIQENLRTIIIEPKDSYVYWIYFKEDNEISLDAAPLNVGNLLNEYLFNEKDTIILTSATLSVENDFNYLKNRLGLDESFEFKQIPSNFDYKRQAKIYIATDTKDPKTPGYTEDIKNGIIEAVKVLKGRTLILFTSHSAIKTMYEKIFKEVNDLGIEVLAQKISGGREKILEKFKTNPKSILLGTSSFWEGIDISGEALSCIIITKLPFEVPSEPVFDARQRQYKNGFEEFALPQAVLRFKQGFGRLIRTSKDRGIVIVLDSRINKRDYGLKFLESLPETNLEYGEVKRIGKVVEGWMA